MKEITMPRHFTHFSEHTPEEILDLVELAIQLKKNPQRDRPLAGKSLALCFINPSSRTQVSFEVAAASLRAHPVVWALGTDTWKSGLQEAIVMTGAPAEHGEAAVP